MKDTIKNLEWRYAVKKFDADRILPGPKVEGLKKAFNLTEPPMVCSPLRCWYFRIRASKINW